VKKTALAALVGATVIALVALGSSSAFAGATVNVSSNIGQVGHGSVTPEFSITVGDDYAQGTMSGMNIQVPSVWTLNRAFRSSPAYNSNGIEWTGPGVCGIQVVKDATNTPLAPGTFGCTFQSSDSGNFRLVSIREYHGTPLQVPQPMTVTFMPGAFTAPASGATSNWRVAARNDEDPNGGGLPVNLPIALTDVSVAPVEQTISCPVGDPVESTLLSGVGFDAPPTFSLETDLPPGFTFDPVTGIISGTPTIEFVPSAQVIIASGQRGGQPATASSTINLTRSLPDTGFNGIPVLWAGSGLVAAGIIVVAIELVRRRRKSPRE
jgi:hypothetical protein